MKTPGRLHPSQALPADTPGVGQTDLRSAGGMHSQGHEVSTGAPAGYASPEPNPEETDPSEWNSYRTTGPYFAKTSMS